MRILVPFLVALVLAGCAGVEPRPAPLTRDDIVRMAKAGESPDAIIQALQQTHSVIHLSASDIVRLHKEGVPQDVLDYLQRTQIEEVRRREAFAHMNAWPLYASPWPLYATPFRCPPWPYRATPFGWPHHPFWPGC